MNIFEVHVNVENRQREMTRNRELFTEKEIESNGIIILALEKQISKKVVNIHENWDIDDPDTFASTEGNCPSCKEKLVTYALQKYCDYCGQAISWEVEE